LAVLTIGLLAASCGGNSIDRLLDEYDKLVDDMVEYAEELRQSSNSSDGSDPAKALARLATVQKEMEKFQKKAEAIGEKLGKYEDDMSAEQTERLMWIIFKMAEVFE
jgi:uncharacterized protein YukE